MVMSPALVSSKTDILDLAAVWELVTLKNSRVMWCDVYSDSRGELEILVERRDS